MLHNFKAYCKAHLPCLSAGTTLLAVSGGRDSVVMCDLFHKAEYPFAIAHVNFQLRGRASDKDAAFVAHIAQLYGVRLYSITVDTKAYAAQNKCSIQVAARELRFDFFKALCNDFGYPYYAAAHHQDDAVETYIINQLRGCGLSGLHGILPQQAKLLHPLLFCNRKQIDAYVAQHSIHYVEDATNVKQDYMRNKIRHSLMPMLERIRPQSVHMLWENSLRLQATEKLYKEGLIAIKQKYSIAENILDLAALQKNANAVTLLYEWLSIYGFNYSQCEQMLHQISVHTNAQQFCSLTHCASLDRGKLYLQKQIEVEEREDIFYIKATDKLLHHPFAMRIKYLSAEAEILRSSRIAMLDKDRLSFPLCIRKWKKGDSFMPLGMGGRRKLLSDFFTDLKLSPQQKRELWLLCSAEDTILWVVGYRISEAVKITSATQSIWYGEI